MFAAGQGMVSSCSCTTRLNTGCVLTVQRFPLLPARPTGRNTGNGFHSLSVFPLFLLRLVGSNIPTQASSFGRRCDLLNGSPARRKSANRAALSRPKAKIAPRWVLFTPLVAVAYRSHLECHPQRTQHHRDIFLPPAPPCVVAHDKKLFHPRSNGGSTAFKMPPDPYPYTLPNYEYRPGGF